MDWFWRERRRRRKAAKAAKVQREKLTKDPVREFIYLDEVSVTSLVSSILGKVPSEFTDTSNIAAKGQRNAGIDTAAGSLKVKVGFANESTRTDDAKVQSKATIQALFRRLYKDVSPILAMQPPGEGSIPPSAEKVKSVLSGKYDDAVQRWVADPARLKRGSLAELQVELYPDPVFRLSAIMTTLTELVSEGKEQLGGIGPKNFNEMVSINAILERLLAGLVPLKCRLVDYVAVRTSFGESLIHSAAIAALPPDARPPTREVFLVGVVDRSSFWKDIRRVLFSRARFRVLCRLNDDGLTQEWDPVKLVQVFDELDSNISEALYQFSSGAIQSFSTSQRPLTQVPPLTTALLRYGQLVSAKVAVELDADDLRRMVDIATASVSEPWGIDRQRPIFTQVAEVVLVKSTTGLSPAVLSELRMQALEESGLLPGSEVQSTPVNVDQGVIDVDEWYLDAEFIAIYW